MYVGVDTQIAFAQFVILVTARLHEIISGTAETRTGISLYLSLFRRIIFSVQSSSLIIVTVIPIVFRIWKLKHITVCHFYRQYLFSRYLHPWPLLLTSSLRSLFSPSSSKFNTPGSQSATLASPITQGISSACQDIKSGLDPGTSHKASSTQWHFHSSPRESKSPSRTG